MRGRPVPSQLDQVLPRCRVQEAGPYHPTGRIRIGPFGKRRHGFSGSRGIFCRRPATLADRARRDPACGAVHQLALRCRCPLCLQGQHELDRLQGASERDLRRGAAKLADKGLLPVQHIVDTGYLSAGQLVQAQRDFGLDLVGPARVDSSWQAKAGKGFAMDAFIIDWDTQRVTCPMGVHSSSWSPATEAETAVVKVRFSATNCQACPHRSDCAGPTATRRIITFRTRDEYIALQAARHRQTTPEFRSLYALRAGIEGTISQGVRAFDLRRSRYFGQAKTHLQHVAIAAAMNLVRLVHWILGDTPVRTRRSHFSRLVQAQAAN